MQHPWLWQPSLIVFFSSACIMILELVAGRLIAAQVGVSLYTWTSIIGIILAGISLGNYIGGRLADRWASLKMLGLIFLNGGAFTLFILAIKKFDLIDKIELSYIGETMFIITVMFFIPATLLGTISPVVVKLSVSDLNKTGSTVGKIYAAGAIGSIAGTFVTGFWLISWFGTNAIIWGVGMSLMALGLLLWIANRWLKLLSVVFIVLIFFPTPIVKRLMHQHNVRETNYFTINVTESEYEGEKVLKLFLDQLLHSYTFVNDPTRLKYEYLKMFAWITTYHTQDRDSLNALLIGGGGYTFPIYLEANYPNCTIHVIEIDPEVTEVAHDRLGLSRDTKIVSYNLDARMYIAREPTETYDLIFADAFNDFSVPFHLTTWEFHEQIKRWLADDGIYLINLVDGHEARFLSAYTHTLRQSFRYVYAGIDDYNWRKYRSTYVLAASDQPFDFVAMGAANQGVEPTEHRLMTTAQTAAVLDKGDAVLLTDNYAPVDQLLAAVFRDSGED